MVILYILGGIIAFVLLLLCVPVEVDFKYNEKAQFSIRYFFLPIQVYPHRKKKEKPKSKAAVIFSLAFSKAKKLFNAGVKQTKKFLKKLSGKLKIKKRKTKSKSETEKTTKKKKSAFAELREERGFFGMLDLLWRVVKLATGAFCGILRGLIVKKFDFFVTVRGEDASETAVEYGELCAVLYPATAAILGAVRRYKQNIVIEPDFSGGQTETDVHVIFRAYPILAAGHGAKALLVMIWQEISDKIKEKTKEASFNTTQGGVNNG